MTLPPAQTARSAQFEVLPETRPDARPEASRDTREALARIMKAAGALTPTPPAAAGALCVGHVSEAGAAANEWRIVLPAGALLTARTALTCVVQPQPDDLVQLYVDNGRCWVLAILERNAAHPALTLDFGAASVLLQAHAIRVQAHDRMTLEAAHFASRAEVITQAAAERQAHIGGTDATHAGNTLIHTERHMGLHAKSAAITSASLLKIDGGQIHLG